MRYYVLLVLHVSLIAVAWISPFLFDWRLVVAGAIAYMIAGEIWQYCPVTLWQFGGKKKSFYQYYLARIGVKLSRQHTVLVVRYLIPTTIALLAVLRRLL